TYAERAYVLAEAICLDDHFSERGHVPEAEIHALACNGMDAMRRVAGKSEARSHEGARQCEAERPCMGLVGYPDLAEPEAETTLQLGFEQQIVPIDQPFGFFRALGPDDQGPVPAFHGRFERKDGKRTRGQEMFLGAAIVRPLVLDCADDSRLAIIPFHRLDTRHVAQTRSHAVGCNKQARAQGCAVSQMYCC